MCVDDETIELLVPKAAQDHEESSKGKNAQQELPSGWRHRAAAAQNMAPAATPASAAAAATPEAPESGRRWGAALGGSMPWMELVALHWGAALGASNVSVCHARSYFPSLENRMYLDKEGLPDEECPYTDIL